MKTHITDNESLHNFFSSGSKVLLIFPIIIVIISLFFKFNQPKTSKVLNVNVEPTIIIDAKKNDIKFDLKGPIVCDNLFIHNRQVLLKNKSFNYLLKGDCVYIWETNKAIGTKKCDLSTFIGLAESYLNFMSVDDLINNALIKDKIKNKDIDLTKVIKSCKREEVKDKKVFEVPSKILFKLNK